MTVYAITDTKKGEQGLRLLILKLPGNLLELKLFHGPHFSINFQLAMQNNLLSQLKFYSASSYC